MKTNTHTYIGIRITIVTILFLSIFPIRIFIYPSMFIHFLFCIFSCIGGTAITIVAFRNNSIIPASGITVLSISWLTFISIYSLIVSGDLYKTGYLSCSLLYIISIHILIKQQIITKKLLLTTFGIIGVTEGIVCFLQHFSIIDPVNRLFPITGTFNNPNITALAITTSLPFFFNQIKMKKREIFNFIISVFIISALFLLKCRTAIIGTGIIIFVFILSEKSIRNYIRKVSKKSLSIIIIGTICLLTVSGYHLYSFKKDSADGRILIWKIASEMIFEKPGGYRYGLFDKNYNIAQEEYFSSKTNTTFEERKNARHVITGYNDYIEQSIEGGIAGGLFITAFYALFILTSIRNKDIPALSIAVSSAVMSVFYTLTYTLPIWTILISYYAMSSEGMNLTGKKENIFRYFAIILIGITSCFWGIFQCRTLYAQVQIKEIVRLSNHEKEKALKIAAEYSPYISTDWTYRRIYARLLTDTGAYDNALEQGKIALQYTEHPSIHFLIAEIYYKTGDKQNAEKHWKKISDMIPSDLRSRSHLLDLYINDNKHAQMKKTASEIIKISTFSKDKKRNMYRLKAMKCLKENP